MKIYSLRILLTLAIACCIVQAEKGRAAGTHNQAFTFKNVGYFHRWSKNDQHEFTPEKQEDLNKWSDMITINAYPNIGDGEHLATAANSVLENYKSHQARVLKTRSVPRTANHPAEHLIAVVFTRPDFSEIAFARFKLMDGKGCSIVYSHRIYGENTGNQTNAWLVANGDGIEKALMDWSSMPSPGSLNPELL